MRLTRHADYAVRVMVDLAAHPGGTPIPRARIGQRQDIPLAYLAKIVQSLVRAGLVRTQPGAHGGISLNAAADRVTLRRVVEAVEGPLELNRCVVRPGACPRDRICAAHPVWVHIQRLVTRELEAVTVAALAGPRARAAMEERFRACS